MKKQTTKQILASTLLELSKHKSVDKITVQHLVKESGVSVQTFYNHFRDKAELVLWIHKSAFDQYLEKLERDEYTYRDFTIDNIRFYSEHKDFMWNALTHTDGQDSYVKMSAENMYQVLKRYILRREKLQSLPEDIDFYLKMYCIIAPNMFAEWAFNMKDTSPETFAGYTEGVMPEALKPFLLKFRQ